ncbi:hypothetical protein CGLO_05463 [Colletotrichum gloeosporioides Cg-14]|uniref:Uncharacterized protein n=1 Tax=Colletotrichum gloeosporioides (strain Cg-14) TaxID=1237896 RepID=T0KRG8_COLGC|nr:hypothetical protein CGLO_05463 [Colletotrichum gloeosporioides Cg-14]
MGKKPTRTESFSDKEEGGAKLDTRVGDAMDVDSTPAPKVDAKKSAADALSDLIDGEHTSPGYEDCVTGENRREAQEEERIQKVQVSGGGDRSSCRTLNCSRPRPAPESSNASKAEVAPLPFIIDVNPTKHTIAHEDTVNPSASERDTSVAPSTIAPSTVNGDGLNRAARRRLMQIDRHRISIRKELGIPPDSDERQDEVETLLAAWIKLFDEKVDARKSKKLARQQSRVKGKGKGKHQGGRSENVKQKQIKKQKQKGALRRRQEAASETN